MNFPAHVRVGDTVCWRESSSLGPLATSITSSRYQLTFHLRAKDPNVGQNSIVGTAYGEGWEFKIHRTITSTWEAGEWFWQAVATTDDDSYTIGSGRFDVLPDLSKTTNTGGFDPRTPSEIELEQVDSALQKLRTGAQEYSVGSRTFKRADLKDLLMYRAQLVARVNREKTAEKIRNGLGNPQTLHVRF